MHGKRIIVAVVAGVAILAYIAYAMTSSGKAPAITEPVDDLAFAEGIVTASGVVVPARQAKLGFARPGQVKRVAVQVGDSVRAGQILAELESAGPQADVDTAQAALDMAKADLALLEAGPRSEEIEGAQATYRGALARYQQTEAGTAKAEIESAEAAVQATRERLTQAQASAKAQEAVAMAKLDSVQASLEVLTAGPKSEEVRSADLALEQARNTLWAAQIDRDGVKGTFGKDSYQGQAADARVAAGETAVNLAATSLLKLKHGPSAEELRIARAAVASAEAELAAVRETKDETVKAAESGMASATARLAQLKAGATTQERQIAASAIEGARAALALQQAGPSSAAVDAAQARVRQSEGMLRRSKADLEQVFLASTFDATVGAVMIAEGETPAPGTVAVIVGDTGNLRIETTDLRETSIARVRVGQTSNVNFDALPDQTFRGKVTRIAPMATPGSGGTNYAVTIDLEKPVASLRWGMTANVEIDTR